MDEALTPAQRIKRGRLMKAKSNIIAKKRARAMKKRAPSEVIQFHKRSCRVCGHRQPVAAEHRVLVKRPALTVLQALVQQVFEL